MARNVQNRSTRATRAAQLKELRELEQEQQRRNFMHAMGLFRTRQQREADQQNLEPQIIFARGHPPDRLRGNRDDARMIVIVPEELYRRFLRLVYLIAFIFISIASAVSLALCHFCIDLKKEIKLPFFTWLTPAIALIVLVNCCPQAKRMYPLNWILAVFVMMLLAMTMAYMWLYIQLLTLVWGMLIAGGFVIISYAMGAFLPIICLPGGPISSCLLLIVLIVWLVLFLLMFFISDHVYALLFYVVTIFIAFMQMLIQGQFLHGRLPVLPLFTMPFSALTIFGFYFVALICAYMFYKYGDYKF